MPLGPGQRAILQRVGGEFVKPQGLHLHLRLRGAQPQALGALQAHLSSLIVAVDHAMALEFGANELVKGDAVAFVQAREQPVHPRKRPQPFADAVLAVVERGRSGQRSVSHIASG